MRISDWSSDVFSSDLLKKCRCRPFSGQRVVLHHGNYLMEQAGGVARVGGGRPILSVGFQPYNSVAAPREHGLNQFFALEHLSSFARERVSCRSEEHTSELQSLMRISYAVFCLKKKKTNI